jgi:hypothetical protein
VILFPYVFNIINLFDVCPLYVVKLPPANTLLLISISTSSTILKLYIPDAVLNDVSNIPLDVNLNKFNTIRVVKNNDEFIVFLNDSWYFNGKIEGKLYDYSDKVIYIGVANPYCENKNECWFSGEISDVKIYNSSNETLDDLYAWFDFEMISNFKIYDKSGNGNHGERFESNKIKEKHNIEYNKFARPAKIV